LNMKKSWHPLLLKNQERVWLEEKKALEEKKKLDQLRKELEEERQLQELQRLQEEQTGRKKSEKLEWMYATPATGSGSSANDLEDYLLGKKRVDKMLTGDENAKIGATHKNFIAVQNANTARDIAAKIREDPLFAIKQQEQAAYQALLINPLRLKELQERNGIKAKRSDRKRDKEARRAEKKRLKALAKGARSPRSISPLHRRYSRSNSPDHDRRYATRIRSRSPHCRPDNEDRNRRSRSRDCDIRRPQSVGQDTPPRGDDGDRKRKRTSRTARSSSPSSSLERKPKMPYREGTPERYDDPRRTSPREYYSRPPAATRPTPSISAEEDRAARLAAMSSSAQEMNLERRQRLEMMLKQETEDKAREDQDRMYRAKSGGVGGFLDSERRKVYAGGMEGGLGERIRRGRGAMVGVD